MRRPKPDPEGFRTAIRNRKKWRASIGDHFQLAKLAERFGVSPDEARSILRDEGWTREVRRGTLPFWWRDGRRDGGGES